MIIPATSGSVAHLLGVTEPRLNDLVRRNKVAPTPPVQGGRRYWHREHIRLAADALGVLTPDLEARLDADANVAHRA